VSAGFDGRDYFESLARELEGMIRGNEIFTCSLHSESSDFVRLSRARVRQAGSVTQHHLELELIEGKRHARAELTMAGDLARDRPRLAAQLDVLREIAGTLPEDPHLLYSREPCRRTSVRRGQLPDGEDAVSQVLERSSGRDLVGIYAAGATRAGFANSLGQRNWYENESFNLDFSFYLPGVASDKAVQSRYAGMHWRSEELERRFERAGEQLRSLARPPRELPPGHYRVFLTPAALENITEMMSWGGFGLRAHRSRTTPLLRLAEGEVALDPAVRIAENTEGGIAPDFQSEGFLRPAEVPLIEAGRYAGHLVSPRSAVEYDVTPNGAEASESPLSLDMAGGELSEERVLGELGTGIYLSNLWYLNFSDRRSCRTTGMTRFATFWVEGGQIQAPLSAMRFDDSIYRMLGDKLVALTREREMRLDPDSYGARSVRSVHLPGALVDDFRFTL